MKNPAILAPILGLAACMTPVNPYPELLPEDFVAARLEIGRAHV